MGVAIYVGIVVDYLGIVLGKRDIHCIHRRKTRLYSNSKNVLPSIWMYYELFEGFSAIYTDRHQRNISENPFVLFWTMQIMHSLQEKRFPTQ
jgi:hypothetical protein